MNTDIEQRIGAIISQNAETDAKQYNLVQKLAWMGTPAIPVLVGSFNHPDPNSRLMAVQAVQEIARHHPTSYELVRAVPALIRNLGDYELYVRNFSHGTLVLIGTRAIGQSIRAFDEPNQGVACEVAEVLGRIAKRHPENREVPQIFSTFSKALKDPKKRRAAIVGLEEVATCNGNRTQAGKLLPRVPELIEIAKGSGDDKLIALRALTHIADSNPGRPELLEAAPLFVEAVLKFGDSGPIAKSRFEAALVSIGILAIPPLMEVFERTSRDSAEDRCFAANVLGDIGKNNPERREVLKLVPKLRKALLDDTYYFSSVRESAAAALVKIAIANPESDEFDQIYGEIKPISTNFHRPGGLHKYARNAIKFLEAVRSERGTLSGRQVKFTTHPILTMYFEARVPKFPRAKTGR